MKPPQIPKGLHARYYHDDTGETVCVLAEFENGELFGRATGFARYNPADWTDPLFPFDPNKGRAIALKRAIRAYNKGWW